MRTVDRSSSFTPVNWMRTKNLLPLRTVQVHTLEIPLSLSTLARKNRFLSGVLSVRDLFAVLEAGPLLQRNLFFSSRSSESWKYYLLSLTVSQTCLITSSTSDVGTVTWRVRRNLFEEKNLFSFPVIVIIPISSPRQQRKKIRKAGRIPFIKSERHTPQQKSNSSHWQLTETTLKSWSVEKITRHARLITRCRDEADVMVYGVMSHPFWLVTCWLIWLLSIICGACQSALLSTVIVIS